MKLLPFDTLAVLFGLKNFLAYDSCIDAQNSPLPRRTDQPGLPANQVSGELPGGQGQEEPPVWQPWSEG